MRKFTYTLMAFSMMVGEMECYAQTVSGQVAGYDYVDLGLPSGTKWATCNVGATKSTEFGGYFAWGETKPKEIYNWSTYKLRANIELSDLEIPQDFTKYSIDRKDGTVDNKTVLDAEDDAATANWGSAWRMPTKEEADELLKGCTWKQVPDFKGSGVCGLIGVSIVNGNIIFVPSAGGLVGSEIDDAGYDGGFWLVSLCSDRNNPRSAYDFHFMGSEAECSTDDRYYGKSVRAVTK